MNKMLDKEDFTMMKRAIFATQVWLGPLNPELAALLGESILKSIEGGS